MREESTSKMDNFIRGYFIDSGVVPLFDVYPGKNTDHLPFRCVCGNESSVSWQSVQIHTSNPRCNTCKIENLPRGENHPNWNFNLTDDDRDRDGRGRSSKLWVRLMLEASEFKSNLTGKEGRLAVHHLNSWADFPNERYIFNNGVVLLEDEHIKFHSDCGMGSTRDVFKKWCGDSGYEFSPLLSENTIIEVLDSPLMNLNDVKNNWCKSYDNYIALFLPELVSRSSAIVSMIKYKSGVCKVVGARKLKIVNVYSKQSKEFFDKWHIQGSISASFCYGLSDGNELYAVMSFGKPRYLGMKEEWELFRFAIKGGYSVPGGAGRLFNHAIGKIKPTSMAVFADCRFAHPDPFRSVYSKIGFKFQKKTHSSYWYANPGKDSLWNRRSFQKQKIKKMFDIGDLNFYNPDLTESNNMELNGYIRYSDCGSFRFVWGKI